MASAVSPDRVAGPGVRVFRGLLRARAPRPRVRSHRFYTSIVPVFTFKTHTYTSNTGKAGPQPCRPPWAHICLARYLKNFTTKVRSQQLHDGVSTRAVSITMGVVVEYVCGVRVAGQMIGGQKILSQQSALLAADLIFNQISLPRSVKSGEITFRRFDWTVIRTGLDLGRIRDGSVPAEDRAALVRHEEHPQGAK